MTTENIVTTEVAKLDVLVGQPALALLLTFEPSAFAETMVGTMKRLTLKGTTDCYYLLSSKTGKVAEMDGDIQAFWTAPKRPVELPVKDVVIAFGSLDRNATAVLSTYLLAGNLSAENILKAAAKFAKNYPGNVEVAAQQWDNEANKYVMDVMKRRASGGRKVDGTVGTPKLKSDGTASKQGTDKEGAHPKVMLARYIARENMPNAQFRLCNLAIFKAHIRYSNGTDPKEKAANLAELDAMKAEFEAMKKAAGFDPKWTAKQIEANTITGYDVSRIAALARTDSSKRYFTSKDFMSVMGGMKRYEKDDAQLASDTDEAERNWKVITDEAHYGLGMDLDK